MAIHPLWTDDYWLLIMQLYQKSPAGVKSEYSRSVVELALELHIPPKTLQEQMEALKERTTPSLQRLWETYADNPRRLSRDVKRLRQMTGFGAGSTFYNGIDLTQPFEHDYLPVAPTDDQHHGQRDTRCAGHGTPHGAEARRGGRGAEDIPNIRPHTKARATTPLATQRRGATPMAEV